MSHDAILNTHDIAYEEPNYIWHITTYPDLVIVALANGRYPAQESYNAQSTTMRRHLIGCIENKFLLPFPTHNTGYKSKRRQAKIKKILEMPLYCICKKPDTGTLYVYCDSCQKENHPECLGISSSVNESTLVVCNTCREKS